MNVLVLVSSLSIGGAERQAIVDSELLSRTHNVVLGIFDRGPLVKTVHPRVHLLQIQKGGYLETSLRLAVILRQRRIEVIHASLFAPMVIAALAAQFTKVKVFWHFHSHEYDIPVKSRFAFRILASSPCLKRVLFVSSELRDFIKEKLNLPEGKLGILHNCSLAHPVRRSGRKRGPLTVGYVGRLTGLKRVQYLIELAETLNEKGLTDVRILIIGDGDARDELERYTREVGLRKQVRFNGYEIHPGKSYQMFNIFVQPSSEECLSMALIEAGLHGIPAVAFDVGGNREIIRNGVTGFIVRGKSEFFKRCMELLMNRGQRERMGKAAGRYCRQKFGAEGHLRTLEELYRQNHA